MFHTGTHVLRNSRATSVRGGILDNNQGGNPGNATTRVRRKRKTLPDDTGNESARQDESTEPGEDIAVAAQEGSPQLT